MGCDIHMYLEKKIDGNWVSAVPVTKDKDGGYEVDREARIYRDRNYLLFSVLAGVREPVLFIWQKYEVKGFPDDADPKIQQIYEQWGVDAHTPSYLTLEDIQKVDWVKTGVMVSHDVTERQKKIYEYFRNKALTIKPDEPYLIDPFMYDAIKEAWMSVLECVMEPEQAPTLMRIYAFVPLYLICDEFYHKVILKLEEIAVTENLKHDEIRLVFWFDN